MNAVERKAEIADERRSSPRRCNARDSLTDTRQDRLQQTPRERNETCACEAENEADDATDPAVTPVDFGQARERTIRAQIVGVQHTCNACGHNEPGQPW